MERRGGGPPPSMDEKAVILANPEISADRIAAAQLQAAINGAVVDLFVATGPGIRG